MLLYIYTIPPSTFSFTSSKPYIFYIKLFLPTKYNTVCINNNLSHYSNDGLFIQKDDDVVITPSSSSPSTLTNQQQQQHDDDAKKRFVYIYIHIFL